MNKSGINESNQIKGFVWLHVPITGFIIIHSSYWTKIIDREKEREREDCQKIVAK